MSESALWPLLREQVERQRVELAGDEECCSCDESDSCGCDAVRCACGRHLWTQLDEVLAHQPLAELLQACAQLLSGPDVAERVLAARLLADLRDHEQERGALLLPALEVEEDDLVQAYLIGAFYTCRYPSALPTVLRFVNDPDPETRYGVAGALSACSTRAGLLPGARAALIALATDPDDDVRYSAVFELSTWWCYEKERSAEVRAALRAALRDQDARVRDCALEAFSSENLTGAPPQKQHASGNVDDSRRGGTARDAAGAPPI